MTAPPCPEEGVISWNINTACNYRCSYCTQRFLDDRGRWSRDTKAFLFGFSRLPGRWEIKLSGGEPFVHPTLLEIVAGISEIGHRISVVTNFSAPLSKILQFVEAAKGRVGIFSCSLHLGYVSQGEGIDRFIDKAGATLSALRGKADPTLPPPSLCVTSVATKEALGSLPEIAQRFSDAGLTFKIQPEKQAGDVVLYEAQEIQTLVSLGGHNQTGQISHHFLGMPCWAGARYFILDDRGNAYRCYPARRRKSEKLGNFLDPAFTLFPGPSPCQYSYCNCTVPIERGMMLREVIS